MPPSRYKRLSFRQPFFILTVLSMFYVYILYSPSRDKYYVGYTSNVQERIIEHNSGATNYTRSGKPWNLVYKEEYALKSEAIKRENEIKSKKSRKYIENLINSSVGLERPDKKPLRIPIFQSKKQYSQQNYHPGKVNHCPESRNIIPFILHTIISDNCLFATI